jgi:hypothetical protein
MIELREEERRLFTKDPVECPVCKYYGAEIIEISDVTLIYCELCDTVTPAGVPAPESSPQC